MQLAVIAIVAGFFINYPFPKRAAAAPVEELADVPYLEQISFRQGDLSLSFEPRAYLRDSLVTVEIAAKAGHKNKIRQVSLASGSSSAQGAQLGRYRSGRESLQWPGGLCHRQKLDLAGIGEVTLSVGLPMASLVEAGGTLIRWMAGRLYRHLRSSGNYISGDFERQMSLVALPLARFSKATNDMCWPRPTRYMRSESMEQAYVRHGPAGQRAIRGCVGSGLLSLGYS